MPTYTASELAQAAGIPEDTTRRFFRALGFPDAGDEIRYTEADRAALVGLADSVRAGGVDMATAVRLVRAVGQNVARLSDWQVAALASRAEQIGPGNGTSRGETARQLSSEVAAAMQQVLEHSWRRHLDAALTRLDVDAAVGDDEQTAIVTVGFADLVKFSELANELDADRLGELVEIFEARCGDVVGSHDGRMVKTIGDAVLYLAEDADAAVTIAFGLIDVIGGDSRLPDVRIGLSTGLVVTRLGDVFGPPVNLAARLTSLARRNRVLTDDATVAALRDLDYETRRLTARPLRGFGLVEPVAVRAVRRIG